MPYTHRCTKNPIPSQPGWVTLTGPCNVTGEPHTTPPVREDAIKAYEQGAFAQDVFPELSIPEREFLISGTSPEGWREVFGDEEDDQQGKERP